MEVIEYEKITFTYKKVFNIDLAYEINLLVNTFC